MQVITSLIRSLSKLTYPHNKKLLPSKTEKLTSESRFLKTYLKVERKYLRCDLNIQIKNLDINRPTNSIIKWSSKKSVERKFSSLTDEVLYDHLTGKHTVGLYPLLKDNTCFFLAIDFDKQSWKEDALAFRQTCHHFGIPASIERSRSGNGCHIWIFFDEPIASVSARKLGHKLLNSTKQRTGTSLKSFDRMFPNQDTLPSGGFGNLIALPLQGNPRKTGNSVFVNESWHPYKDQWEYLFSVKKIPLPLIHSIIREAKPTTENKNDFSMPDSVTVTLEEGLHIDHTRLPPSVTKELKWLASFHNPEYYKAQKRRLTTHHLPKVIDCSNQVDASLTLPRGCYDDVMTYFKSKEIHVEVIDKRRNGQTIDTQFKGALEAKQREAADSLFNHNHGVLSATTGFGKTVIAASLIARRNVNTLIIVHRKQLLEQWQKQLVTFLNISPRSIGRIGGGKSTPTNTIDVATIQSLSSNGNIHQAIKEYGQIIVDECHHISAFTFEKVLNEAGAKYVHGLTATPTRKDGLHPIMTMQCGPIRYKVSAKQQAKSRPFHHLLIPKYTSYKSKSGYENKTIHSLYKDIVSNPDRNEEIFNDVLIALEEGKSPLVLTERHEHVDLLEKKLRGFTRNLIVLTGGLSKKEEARRLKLLEEIPESEERVIIATGKYIGEGFDDARLDTLFLTMPVSWTGTLQQYVGRLHRNFQSKKVVTVYDYVDHHEPMLERMFQKRMKGYRSLGYKLKEEIASSDQQISLF